MNRPGSPARLREALSDHLALAVFLVALALRLAWVIFVQVRHPGDSYYLVGDALEYTAVARNLLEGRGWWSPDAEGGPYFHGPIFPLFVAAFLAVKARLFTITVAHALIGAATCWGVTRVARRFTTPAGALAAGLASAFYPYYFHYTGQVMTETLSVLFGLLVFATLVTFSREPTRWHAAAAGLVLGLATLNHPETYVAPPLLLAWALAFHPRRALVARRLVLLCVVMGLTVLPWHAYHAVRNGKSIFLPPALDPGGVLSQGTLVAMGRIKADPAYDRQALELERQGEQLEKEEGAWGAVQTAFGRVFHDVSADPGEYLELMALKLHRMWGLAPEKGKYARPLVVYPTAALNVLVYGGCIVGLFLFRRREESLLALALIAMYTLPHLIFYAQPRYRLPVMPVVIVFAGVAAGAALARAGARGPVPAQRLAERTRGEA